MEQIPSIETILSLKRGEKMTIIFEASILIQREIIGEKLKNSLEGFNIAIHNLEPVINIIKLITVKEIETHQDFFEQCAKDYRKLAEQLIFELAAKLRLDLNEGSPWIIFGQLRNSKKQKGTMNGWHYYLHGFHCAFLNNKSGQKIEVPLVFSLEFGDLDPYFFSQFIKSTKDYSPLPVKIYDNYSDGKQIIETMLSLGKFERINSNFGNHFGIVVTDRNKIEIKPFDTEPKSADQKKKKFSFFSFLDLKANRR